MRSNRLHADDPSVFHLLAKALAFQPTGPFASPSAAGPAKHGSFTRFGSGFSSAIRQRLAGETPPAIARVETAPELSFGSARGPVSDRETAWAMFASGWWLRAALICAVAAVSGVIFLFTGDAKPVPAIALAIGGAVLAPYSWRRVLAIVNRADAAAVRARPGAADHGSGSAALG